MAKCASRDKTKFLESKTKNRTKPNHEIKITNNWLPRKYLVSTRGFWSGLIDHYSHSFRFFNVFWISNDSRMFMRIHFGHWCNNLMDFKKWFSERQMSLCKSSPPLSYMNSVARTQLSWYIPFFALSFTFFLLWMFPNCTSL